MVGICGRNGIGKTNLLDAIYYLCFTKSYFSRSDAAQVRFGTEGFRIEGVFERSGTQERITCILRENGRKEFLVNDQPYDRLAHHIGRFPAVMIAPDDIAIITGGSEERRRYLDYSFSQIDSAYLESLMEYNKVLAQRNSLLRQLADSGTRDYALLDVLDAQLVRSGEPVYALRKKRLETLIPVITGIYQDISGGLETLYVGYRSPLHLGSFKSLLLESRQKDLALQRTTTGIHRDDLELLLEDNPFKSIGSQGQRKSLLFALKLAEMELLREHNGFSPLLLLDDVFEKLDEQRLRNLLQRVCAETDGQVFITDTSGDQLTDCLAGILEDERVQLIELQ